MTTVREVSVKVTANVADFDSKMRAVQSRLARGIVSVDSLSTSTRNLARAKKNAAANIDQATGAIKRNNNALAQALRSHTIARDSANKVGNSYANVGYQLNDIGVMLAAGQNPLVLAAQQGTQLTQIMQELGRKGVTPVKALGEALRLVISPLSALTIAGIAALGFMVQFIRKTYESTKELTELSKALKTIDESIKSIHSERIIAEENLQLEEQVAIYRQIETLLAELAQREKDLENQKGLGKKQARVDIAALQAEIAYYRQRQQIINAEVIAARQAAELAQERLVAAREFANEYASASAAGQGVLSVEKSILQARQDASAEILRQNQYLINTAAYVNQWADTTAVMAQNVSVSASSLETMQAAARKYYTNLKAAQDAIAAGKTMIDAIPTSLNSAVAVAQTLGTTLAAAGAAFFSQFRGSQPGEVYSGRGSGTEWENWKQRREYYDTPDDPKTGGGGGNPLLSELEAVRDALASEEELQIESFQRQQETLQQALEQRLLTQQEYQQLMEAASVAHADRMVEIDAYKHGGSLDVAETFFGDMAAAMRSGNEKMLQISRTFGAAEALINSYRAFAQVIGDPTIHPLQKVALGTAVLGAGLNAANAIRGVTSSGGGGGGVGGSASGSAAASPTASQTSRNVAIELTGGPMYSRDQLVELFNQLNELTEDGAVIRLV